MSRNFGVNPPRLISAPLSKADIVFCSLIGGSLGMIALVAMVFFF